MFITFLAVSAAGIFALSVTVLVFSSVNLSTSFSFEKCTMSNCVLGKPINEIWTCNAIGKCAFVGYIPGLCTSDQNCTTYDSGANFAFNNICYETLSTCDIQLNLAMSYSQYELDKVKPWDVDYRAVQTQSTSIRLNIGLDIPVTTKNILRRNVHYFPEWKSKIRGNLMTTQPFLYEPSIKKALIKLDYNGLETDGIIDFSSDGFIRFFWIDTADGNYTVSEEFDCDCEFYGKVVAYNSP